MKFRKLSEIHCISRSRIVIIVCSLANSIKELWEILKEFCSQAKLFCLYTRDHSSPRKLCVTCYLADNLSHHDDGDNNLVHSLLIITDCCIFFRSNSSTVIFVFSSLFNVGFTVVVAGWHSNTCCVILITYICWTINDLVLSSLPSCATVCCSLSARHWFSPRCS